MASFDGLQVNLLHQIAHLFHYDHTRFGFGSSPMDVAVVGVIDFSATDALVAAIDGRAAAFYRILAIQGFGQRGSQRLQFFDVVAEKKISMTEPPTLKRTLQ